MALAGAAFGQVPPPVTAADIERARQSHRTPTDAELARMPVAAAPRIDALPQPVTKVPIDLEALAKGFDTNADQPALAATAGPTLLVFVSFAMPEPTIGRLIDQSARAGATLVLRGLINGSMRDTVERMQRLIGERRVAVQIDPQAFDRFSIVRTPSFVLVRSGASAQPCSSGTCLASDQFVLAAGDVSLDYALRFFERSAPAMARDASSLLQRMKGSSR
jgi:conjugal transfer pilus assembly protein TrbC